MEIKVNLGLNNNPIAVADAISRFKNTYAIVDGKVTWKLGVSTFEDVAEPTLVLKFNTKFKKLSAVIAFFEQACITYTQDCIALKVDGIGYVVKNYERDVPSYAFDDSLFIDIA